MIDSDLEIFQIDERVFQIGDSEVFNNLHFKNIINLLNKGNKFIPSLFLSIYDIYSFLLVYFERGINNLNMKLFLLEKGFCFNNYNLSKVSVCTDILDIFFDNIKCKANPEKFPLSKLAIDFRFNMYHEFSKLVFNLKSNITKKEIDSIKYFKNRRPFKVLESDKNTGLAIISHSDFITLAKSHLEDINTYELINTNEFDIYEITCNINNSLVDLKLNSKISNRLFNCLFFKNRSNLRIGNFRILPKFHKKKFGIRPIINCSKHFTSKFALLIDLILKPFVVKMPSFIQDSQNLLQHTVNLTFNYDVNIYSCDFESLYTNIDLDSALILITDFMKDKLISKHIKIEGFHKILQIVLLNNFFSFNKCIYRQKRGVAMGAICGPNIANIFIYILETKFLNIHRPFLYKRYIDDILIIVNIFFNIDIIKEFFPGLKLNIECGTYINFLDLKINFCNLSRSLKFSTYIKPTNTFNYLLTTSNHSDSIFKNIPKSIFIRIRRICSFFYDYLYFSRIFMYQLLKRGYKYKHIFKISNIISNVDRNKLIEYKSKDCNLMNNILTFNLPFDFSFLNLEKSFYNIFSDYCNNFNFLDNSRLKIIYKKQLNISDIFVHNLKNDSIKKTNFKKCDNDNCKICLYSNNDYYLNLNNFILPILDNSNCKTTEAIYIIKCKLCSTYYIGQTSNFYNRLLKHIYDIKSFIPFTCFTTVSNHFNIRNHNLKDHFTFYILQTNHLDTTAKRHNVENHIIHLFLALNIKILNDFIPN